MPLPPLKEIEAAFLRKVPEKVVATQPKRILEEILQSGFIPTYGIGLALATTLIKFIEKAAQPFAL